VFDLHVIDSEVFLTM